jgi:hypothetical protein
MSVSKDRIHKVCSKCNVEKLVSEYAVDKQKSDGLCSSCKECGNKPVEVTESVEEKCCVRCHNVKAISEFGNSIKTKDGHSNVCKDCLNKPRMSVEYVKEKPCCRCGEVKEIDQFYKESRAKDGHTTKCKKCIDAIHKVYNNKLVANNTYDKLVSESNGKIKACSICKKSKLVSEFVVRRYSLDGYSPSCKSCRSKFNGLEEGSMDNNQIIEEFLKNERNRRKLMDARKYKVFAHYSGGIPKCANPYHLHNEEVVLLKLLVLDHINGDGYKERKDENGKPNGHGGQALYRKLIKLGFPEGYQVLCHNCNEWKKDINNEYGEKYKKKRLAIGIISNDVGVKS